MNINSDSRHGLTRCVLIRPGRIGIAVRIVVSLGMSFLVALAVRAGGTWLIAAFATGALGILIALAALFRQPRCEVDLIWERLLGKAPIDCFLFGPIDRSNTDASEPLAEVVYRKVGMFWASFARAWAVDLALGYAVAIRQQAVRCQPRYQFLDAAGEGRTRLPASG